LLDAARAKKPKADISNDSLNMVSKGITENWNSSKRPSACHHAKPPE
jgi:hypothetical protein